MISRTPDDRYAGIIRTCLAGDCVTTRNSECYRTLWHRETFTTTPLIRARKTAWKSCLREWEWFMSGSNNLADLHPSVQSWWQPWADARGCVPFNYSQQFRNFYGTNDGVDQVQLLVDGARDHPFSRRNLITTWNTADMVDPHCPITNCHGTIIHLAVTPDNALHLRTYQRSVDVICGLPHNLLQYWAFLLWLAHRSGRKPGSLVWEGGDVHVYEEHADLARRILDATPTGIGPQLVYTPSSDEFRADDFGLDGPYEPVITENARMIV